MLPQTLLRASAHVEGDRLVPHYFTARDEPWLRALIDEYARFVGRKQSELHERLREPLPARAPKSKLRIAMLVLDPLCRARPAAAVPPREARAAVFRAAAASLAPRAAILNSVAASLGVTDSELETALFADLHSEWRLAELPRNLSAMQLAIDANLAIVISLIRRAAHVRVAVRGNPRALVHHARVVGLICRESRLERAADGVVLDLSGPFSLFRHSEIYGRALASLIPRLLGCEQFELTATCCFEQNGHLPSLLVRSGDPLGTVCQAARLESRLARNFERAFRRAAPEWEVIRDPSAIPSGSTLIFPDFELSPREDPSERWLLEIVGFWTPEYLREKLRRLSAAGRERFVLCVDQKRECTRAELPADSRIIGYQTRIEPRAVLAILAANRPGRGAHDA